MTQGDSPRDAPGAPRLGTRRLFPRRPVHVQDTDATPPDGDATGLCRVLGWCSCLRESKRRGYLSCLSKNTRKLGTGQGREEEYPHTSRVYCEGTAYIITLQLDGRDAANTQWEKNTKETRDARHVKAQQVVQAKAGKAKAKAEAKAKAKAPE